MMKRIFALMAALWIMISAAAAEEIRSFEETAAALVAVTEAEWETENEWIRVLTLDSGATVSVCLDGEKVVALTVESMLENGAQEDAQAVFAAAGLLAEEGLAGLAEIEEDADAEMDGYRIWHLTGEQRECYAICAAEAAEELVWQPVHGGKRMHVSSVCSGMDVARLVTMDYMDSLGCEPCGTCATELVEEE